MNEAISFVQAILFYTIPFLAGGLITGWKTDRPSILKLTEAFASGSLALFILMLAWFRIAPALTNPELSVNLFRYLLILITAAGAVTAIRSLTTIRIPVITLIYALVPIALASIVYALWRADSPYPLPLNWDINEHQTIVNGILGGRFAFQTSLLSDTFRFDGYSTIFHALLSLPQIVLPGNPLGFWWMAELLHLTASVLVSAAVTYAFTKNTFISGLAGLIGGLTFESSVAFTSLFLLPQTLAALTVVMAITAILDSGEQLVYKRTAVLLLIFSCLSHYIVGGFGVILALSLILTKRMIPGLKALTTLFACAGLGLGIYTLLSIMSGVLPLSAINSGEAVSFTNSLGKNLDIVSQIYGYSIYLLFPIGIAAAAISKNKRFQLLCLTASGFAALAISPFPYALKFYSIGRFFVHAVMAAGAAFMLLKIKSSVIRMAATGLLALSFLTVFLLNIRYWKQPQLYRGLATQVSPAELTAASFLKNTFPASRSILVSDPSTQYVIESASGINTPGGAYMDKPMRETAVKLLTAESFSDLKSALNGVRDNIKDTTDQTIIIALSGRTREWLSYEESIRNDLSVNIWVPKSFSFDDWKFIRYFETATGLIPVYGNSDIVLYAVPPSGGANL